ncbi:MAG TPA: alkaline phosphatase family protein [Acidobacteriaceae bacterium]
MADDPIEHVVVLMLENQSFDRVVGLTPGVNGVNLDALRSNPDQGAQKSISQNLSTKTHMDFDPPHDYDDVRAQIEGTGTPCAGFVNTFLRHYANGNPAEIMAYYDSNTLPVLNTLAKEFAICDNWFSSVPGPTWPNRFFVNSGTSLGHIDMPDIAHFDPAIHCYDQPTVFERLSEAKKSWRIYFGDFSQTLLMIRQEQFAANYRLMTSFENDCRDATSFPQYVFIEPNFFGSEQNDQHPTSDIRRGDALIASVYNAIRQNDALWNSTLLVILYDEHGGFYDHVDPREPQFKAKAVPPDEHRTPEGFAFDLFGLRVPAILISAFLDSQVLKGVYDHTSLLKYLTDKWRLGPLGNRVHAANNFLEELTWRTTPRSDVPSAFPIADIPKEPNPKGLSEHQKAMVAFSHHLESKMAHPVLLNSDKESLLARIGERFLHATEDVSAYGPVASERLQLYLNTKGADLPAGHVASSAVVKS